MSSADAGEPPVAEPLHVPAATARLVNFTRATGGRVIAVGTTVTRALESAATADGVVRQVDGWTDLVLGPDRPCRVVDGLITGWHDAGASHLLLLEAVAGPELVARAYREAVEHGYLWHEFGDSALLLPAVKRPLNTRQVWRRYSLRMQIRPYIGADKPAVILYPSGTVVTFDDLEARANRLAHRFREAGLREGDTVAILMENNEHIHAVMWAARRSGLYYVPINTHLTAAEAAYIIDNSSAKAIIGSAALRDTLAGLAEHARRGGLPELLLIAGRSTCPAGSGTRNALPDSLIPRSMTRSRATCCSTRRAPPAGPRASNANCRTCHRPRRPA